jgi:hypothetical protein
MKFKVKEVTTDSVKAEYEDGSWALIPIQKGQSKEAILEDINRYGNKRAPFDKVNDVPVTVSDEWIDASAEEITEVDYKTARRVNYPSVGHQLDALHWAREGDDTNLKAVDVAIKEVKTKIPKGTSYKSNEVDKLLD